MFKRTKEKTGESDGYMRVIGRVIEWERERERKYLRVKRDIYICIYIIYIIEPKYNICISDSRVDKRRQSKKITKKAQTTQVKSHTVAQNLQSQSIKFFYFIISVPSSTPNDVNNDHNDDHNDAAAWIHRRRLAPLHHSFLFIIALGILGGRNRHRWRRRRCGRKHRQTRENKSYKFTTTIIIMWSTLLPSSNDRSKIT